MKYTGGHIRERNASAQDHKGSWRGSCACMNASVSATTMVPADAGANCAITWNVLFWEHEIRRHGRVPRGSCYDVLGSQVTHTLNTHKVTHAHRRPGEGRKACERGRLPQQHPTWMILSCTWIFCLAAITTQPFLRLNIFRWCTCQWGWTRGKTQNSACMTWLALGI